MSIVRISRAVVFTLAIAASLHADDWPAAKLTYAFSDNGTRFIRIIPGQSIGETFGFAGARKGPWAKGEMYERQPDRSYKLIADVQLRNPVAPVDSVISNSGAFLTLDNWHNMGYGEVVAIYNAKGALKRSYRLEELYRDDDIKKVRTSVSSRWWRCAPIGFTDPVKQTAVYVSEFRGGKFVFDLTTGEYSYEAGGAKCSSL
jgi:hypothetical protein